LPRLPIRRWRLEEKNRTKAQLDTEARFRHSRLGMENSVLKMIDRIDPLELLAVSASTFIVYDIIKSTPEMLAQAKSMLFTPPIAMTLPFVSLLIDKLFRDQTLTDAQKAELQKIREEPDLVLFIKSFAIAYIMVKHSGQIINGIGNITAFISGFLGLAVI
jgi:hypothetical protein